jgi:hypothetical protein
VYNDGKPAEETSPVENWDRWLLIVVVMLLVCFACLPRYVFLLRIENGEPRVKKGKLTPAFLQFVAEACRDHGVERGWVRGVKRGKQIVLTFASGLSFGFQQRIRNGWHLHG